MQVLIVLLKTSPILMNLQPSDILTEQDVNSGLKLVVKDGLATEAMATLTGSAFLVAMALQMGASNFQIGLLAALPTFANLFQLVAIWLVQKYNNRRAIAVICSIFSRFPLIIIGALPFIFSVGTSVMTLIFLLCFHHFFASLVGASWNSWMKDLVPQKNLGAYFSHRTRLTQILNVTLSLLAAVSLDYTKGHFPGTEMIAYSIMFLVAGTLGMLGIYLLSRTPEPRSFLPNENIFKLICKPLKDKNFRSLLVFNSFWSFSLNLATPFFSVYLMKTLHLSLSYVIGLNIISKASSILFVKFWGRYSDRYSNKTIIHICAPVYIICIIAWTFTSMPTLQFFTLPMLVVIHMLSGMSTSGINLAISNIGLKLAPKEEAIVYIAAKNMFTAFLPAIAPLVGGILADFFASQQWHILHFQQWHFFFLIGGSLAFLSLRLLKRVKEEGEVAKTIVVKQLRRNFRTNLARKTKATRSAKIYRLAILPAIARLKQFMYFN